MRCVVPLREKDPGTGLYFAAFSDGLRLVRVIVGAMSNVSRAAVSAALGSLQDSGRVFKARLAFRSFKVVRNRDESLWV